MESIPENSKQQVHHEQSSKPLNISTLKRLKNLISKSSSSQHNTFPFTGKAGSGSNPGSNNSSGNTSPRNGKNSSNGVSSLSLSYDPSNKSHSNLGSPSLHNKNPTIVHTGPNSHIGQAVPNPDDFDVTSQGGSVGYSNSLGSGLFSLQLRRSSDCSDFSEKLSPRTSMFLSSPKRRSASPGSSPLLLFRNSLINPQPPLIKTSPTPNKRLSSSSRSLSFFHQTDLLEQAQDSVFKLTSARGRSQSEVLAPSWDRSSYEGEFTKEIHDTLMRSTSNLEDFANRFNPQNDDEMGQESDEMTKSSSSALPEPSMVPLASEDLVLDQEQSVSAGTLDRIVDLLTDISTYTGTQYVTDFLYTYHYFMKDYELLERLEQKFRHPIPPEQMQTLTTAEQERTQHLIKIRVINVIKKWVEAHSYDFKNVTLYKPFIQFLELVNDFHPKWGSHIKKLLSAHVIKFFDSNLNTHISTSMKDMLPTSEISTIATIMYKTLPLKDRKKKLRVIKNSFLAQEAIEWLIKRFDLDDRAQAIEILNKMLSQSLIMHHSFKTKEIFHALAVTASEDSIKSEPSSPALQAQWAPSIAFKDKDSTVYYFTRSETANEPEYPEPIVPKQFHPSSTFLDLHPVEVARQLTLIEFNLFAKITPAELSHQAWNKSDADTKAPNLSAFIKRSNTLSYWVATEILLSSNLKQRATVVKRFITVAGILRKMNNWNSLMGVMLGLNLGSIQRLKKTWEILPKTMMDIFETLTRETSASQNYAYYRKTMNTHSYPCLPYFAVYLRDLTFIEDANVDILDNGHVNFGKMKMISKILSDVHRYQSVPYHLKKVENIEKLLKTSLVLKDKDLYKASNICEETTRTMTMGGNDSKKRHSFFINRTKT